ncbi:polyamine ABC transporter substrate-binding protein [Aestuariivirga litoralis]|uniref:polyamine ABC transporter substrate-binding protein n=1 Tax=Aestuariivirga litoralis TaxID=2650924 RepID=UPI0018C4CDF1|nr:polyamine ABC transporter substrate-binding protein [Aestuariivirga litoralis]MBG1230772.1 polyamine ABC transporter substrate-binding protein [Aestuariivirga litoralis]
MKLTRRNALKLAGAAVPALAMPYVQRAGAADKVLNVYSWTDYIGEKTIEEFTKKTGIKVTYDTYTSTNEMEAKMLAGSTGYDIVNHSGLTLQRFVKAGVYGKMELTKLPNWKNLDPDVLRIAEGFDPGHLYAFPYMWGSVGMTYNLDMVKERLPNADLTSLDTVFKPENSDKLADCGISMLDEPTDLIMLALGYLGVPHDTYKKEDMDKVIELFKPIRKNIRTFDSSNYLNAIPNKELCAINDWSGDYATAKSRAADAKVDINLGYFVPKTGAPAWVDFYASPADAKNKENALAFINYMMDPKVIADCTNFTNYANANLAAKKFVNKEVLEDPAVYPTKEVMAALYTPKALTEDDDRLLTDTLNAIKSGG